MVCHKEAIGKCEATRVRYSFGRHLDNCIQMAPAAGMRNFLLSCFLVSAYTLLPSSNVYSQDERRQKEDTLNAGVIDKVTQFYEAVDQKNIPTWGREMAERTWFKNNDEMTIRTVKMFRSHTANKITTRTYPIVCYLFKYKPTGMMYEYRHFSDTAALLQTFRTSDSVNLVSQPRIFHYESEPALPRKLIRESALPDTVIESVNYKRKFLHIKIHEKDYYYVSYSRCDEEARFLKIVDMELGKRKEDACPVTLAESRLMPESQFPAMTQEIIIIDNKLTEDEQKVFDAWEERAKTDAGL